MNYPLTLTEAKIAMAKSASNIIENEHSDQWRWTVKGIECKAKTGSWHSGTGPTNDQIGYRLLPSDDTLEKKLKKLREVLFRLREDLTITRGSSRTENEMRYWAERLDLIDQALEETND